MKKLFNRMITFTLAIVMSLAFVGCGGDDGDDTCAWCNGTGYSGNGATNATEYVLKKTPCKHCNGKGYI